MNRPFEFWDALAPHHAAIEDSYLGLSSLRRIVDRVHSRVLVVGAGQGLIVGELQKRGFECDGVDLSSEMIRYAKLRRGLELVQADARAMPFESGVYKTIIYVTGVIDFMSDEEEIQAILKEGRRVASDGGVILVAFSRISAATEKLVARLGLLENNVLHQKETLELYQLKPVQALRWIAKRANVSLARAAVFSLWSWAGSSWQEKRNAFLMQRVFANASQARALLAAAPEQLPYRNEAEIRNLFNRLAIPIKEFGTFGSCYIAQV